MNKLRLPSTPIMSIVAAILIIGAAVIITEPSSAFSIIEGVNAAKGEGQPTELLGDAGVLTTITNILLFVVGALSVIMLIVGGLRYVISGGNASAVTAAKNTILYAIVGLIIAFLAYAAINFVLGAVAPGGGVGSGGTNV